MQKSKKQGQSSAKIITVKEEMNEWKHIFMNKFCQKLNGGELTMLTPK